MGNHRNQPVWTEEQKAVLLKVMDMLGEQFPRSGKTIAMLVVADIERNVVTPLIPDVGISSTYISLAGGLNVVAQQLLTYAANLERQNDPSMQAMLERWASGDMQEVFMVKADDLVWNGSFFAKDGAEIMIREVADKVVGAHDGSELVSVGLMLSPVRPN